MIYPLSRRVVWTVLLPIAALILLGGVRVQQWLYDPRVILLVGDADAHWVRHSSPFQLRSQRNHDAQRTMFRCDFELSAPVTDATLTLQAYRTCRVWLDAAPEFSEPLATRATAADDWKMRHRIPLRTRLNPGRHQLWIEVSNAGAHPCLLASSQALGIASGRNWESSLDRQNWTPSALVTDPVPEIASEIQAAGIPNVSRSFVTLLPWLLVMFGVACGGFWWRTRSIAGQSTTLEPMLSPSFVRGGLLFAWVLMAVNNIGRVPPWWGFDSTGHLDYLQFVVQHQRIPLATDGWQMFQSPLLYLLAAPGYALASHFVDALTAGMLIRGISLLCGMAQIEMIYRISRAVFPGRHDQQIITTLIGGLMPVNIYMSQVFGNEPLAACLTSWVILHCVTLLVNPTQPQKPRFFVLMGVVWGLALLSKVTPLLLAPLIFAVVLYHCVKCEGTLRACCTRLGFVFGACLATSGWYYLRNWMYLGQPFVGGWDPSTGFPWWQDPSYRSWSQLTSFGASLNQPVYSGALSFWDAIYSSLWADGFLSGSVIVPVDSIPWNVAWMEVGVWFAVLPMTCILAGVFRIWGRDVPAVRNVLMFAVAAVGFYLAAVLDLYMHLPVYSTAKASYLLGLLPCLAVLGGAGAGPLLRVRWLRVLFFSTLMCWSVASYLAFYCRH